MEKNNFDNNRYNFLHEANMLLNSNNLNDALDLAADRLQNYPADFDATEVYCEALIGLGRLEELRSLLSEVAEIISRFNIIHERAGDACRENGFHHEAAACYEKFISLHPDADRSRDIIEKMAFLEQEDRPTVEINSDNNNNPEQDFYTITMAQLYINQGHLKEAETILGKMINNEPYNTEALAMLESLRKSRISLSAKEYPSLKNNNLIQILSSWLKNIERLRINAAEKSRV